MKLQPAIYRIKNIELHNCTEKDSIEIISTINKYKIYKEYKTTNCKYKFLQYIENLDVVYELEKNNVIINKKHHLFYLIENEERGTIEYILKKINNFNLKNDKSLMDYLIRNNYLDYLVKNNLINCDEEILYKNILKPFIFHVIDIGNINQIKLLLNRNFDINILNQKSNTFQYLLVKYENEINIDIVNILINKKINLNNINNSLTNPTLLLHLIKIGNIELIELLLKNKVETEIVNSDGKTALLRLFISDYFDINILKLLLNHGVQINHLDKDKKSALYYAIKLKYYLAISLLINNGAKIKFEYFDSKIDNKIEKILLDNRISDNVDLIKKIDSYLPEIRKNEILYNYNITREKKIEKLKNYVKEFIDITIDL
jgi:ankyrin repeat protein